MECYLLIEISELCILSFTLVLVVIGFPAQTVLSSKLKCAVSWTGGRFKIRSVCFKVKHQCNFILQGLDLPQCLGANQYLQILQLWEASVVAETISFKK